MAHSYLSPRLHLNRDNSSFASYLMNPRRFRGVLDLEIYALVSFGKASTVHSRHGGRSAEASARRIALRLSGFLALRACPGMGPADPSSLVEAGK